MRYLELLHETDSNCIECGHEHELNNEEHDVIESRGHYFFECEECGADISIDLRGFQECPPFEF